MSIIRILDVESTGMDVPPAEVIEIGYADLVNDENQWLIKPPVSRLCGVKEVPPEVRAIHHIRASDVAGLAPFDPWLFEQDAIHDGVVVFAAHNLDFDRQFFAAAKIPMICTYKAALRIWPDAPSHSNGALFCWLEDQGMPIGRADLMDPPHRTGPDTLMTAHVLRAMLIGFNAPAVTARQMAAWTKEPRLFPRINFGKHKGVKWEEAPPDYLMWVAQKSDLDNDTKWNAERELIRRREAREPGLPGT